MVTLAAAAPRRSRGKFWSLVSTHAMNDFQTGAVAALLPYLISERHYDYAAAAGITLAATSLSSIAQPLFGILCDRLSLRPLVLIGLLVAAGGVGVAGLTSRTYWLTWLIVALSGIGVAAYHPPATVAAKEAGGGTNRSMSVFSVGGNVGVALAPVAVGITVGVFGLNATPLLLIPTVVVAAVYLLVHASRRSSADAAPAETHAERAAEAAPLARDVWGQFSWLLVLVAFWSIAYIGTQSFIALYSIQRFDATAATASIALTVFPAAGAAGTLTGGVLADRFGRKIVMRSGYLLAALASLAVLTAPSVIIVTIAAAVLGFALFLPFALHVTLSHSYLPRHIGTASGVTLGMSTTLGGFFTPALGSLADHTSVSMVFVIIAIALGAGFACSLFVRERKDHAVPEGDTPNEEELYDEALG
ncbi:MFS transporter [Streptomyces sp. NPDC059814]|uniref:MFS transporter n=1 Tax=Streptomyces sp. NPDC059814 TaxID=3346959 RepID=UPI0036538B1E